MPVVSVSMPESLLGRLDELIEEHEYSGRSEAVRASTRALLAAHRASGDNPVNAVLTVRFDHNSNAKRGISELRHEYDDIVVTSLHTHIDRSCLELLVLEGDTEPIATCTARLRTVDGVFEVEQTELASLSDNTQDRRSGQEDGGVYRE